MKLLIFLLKILKWVFLIVVLPVVLYIGLAALLSYWGTNPKKLDCAADQTIYISSNGMHIDLIMPTASLPSKPRAGLLLFLEYYITQKSKRRSFWNNES